MKEKAYKMFFIGTTFLIDSPFEYFYMKLLTIHKDTFGKVKVSSLRIVLFRGYTLGRSEN